MAQILLPRSYTSALGIRETERAIPFIRELFQDRLSKRLNLVRVSAPPFLESGTGLQDDLNGVERRVTFFPGMDSGVRIEVPNSLAKWKRWALAKYGFQPGEGIWTNMNAIRPDEVLDPLHSLYVDQWDWERIIVPEQRNPEFLKWVVRQIYEAIKETEHAVCEKFGLPSVLPQEIKFMATDELEAAHSTIDRKERENAIVREAGALFLMKIGAKLNDGQPHDGRAPDYDDWKLNGDILVWNPVLEIAFELSSMGIRVDKDALVRQLRESNQEGRLSLMFHRMLMSDELPLTVGGGIGQSRLCMQLLGKAHIGEVHSAWWPEDMVRLANARGVVLL